MSALSPSAQKVQQWLQANGSDAVIVEHENATQHANTNMRRRLAAQDPQSDIAEMGRRLGHDIFRFCKFNQNLDWSTSVLEGFALARAQGFARRDVDRFVRKWLQLRLNAFTRGRFVDEQVTPQFLAKLDVAYCPVTRLPLTHAECKPTDWSIDRLNNDGAYAPCNLAVMSAHANQAKGNRSFDDVLALANLTHATNSLEPGQWMRLAALMLGPCFAKTPHLAPVIPLTAPIPKYTVRMTMQQVQHAFTTLAHRPRWQERPD